MLFVCFNFTHTHIYIHTHKDKQNLYSENCMNITFCNMSYFMYV